MLVVCSLLYTTLLEQALAFNFHSQARPCCQYPATPASFSAVSLPITSFLFRRRYYSPSTLLFPLRCPSFLSATSELRHSCTSDHVTLKYNIDVLSQ